MAMAIYGYARASTMASASGPSRLTRQVVENVLSRHLDDLGPRLTRHGYTVRALAEQFSAKPAEVCQLFRGEAQGHEVRLTV